MRAYLELTKPRITWLILMSTGIGYWFGLRPDWDWVKLIHTLLGTGLLASGTAVLNQWYERDTDAKMRRTKGRPLPTGRVSPRAALLFGMALSVAGFLELYLAVNALAALLGLATLASYLLIYTPLKQVSPICTTVGAFPGAMPPLIGFAAAAGQLTAQAWVLYAILFLWQFPHFLAIAWIYREDYARGGIAMLPVVRPGGEEMARQILISSLVLIPVSLVPGLLETSGWLYLAGALTLGLIYFGTAARAACDLTAIRARQLLLASVAYLPLLYMFMLIDGKHT
ncbi:MAG: protoheme IX farnesyltransferase [Acidobacteriales bacterium]|nr:MAG: protoheme IX farnesyltransferase [Terriglobales bacterium]